MTIPIYILGAGGAAKEIYLLIKQINQHQLRFDFKGFIDVKPKESYMEMGNSKLNIVDEKLFRKNNNESVALALGIGNPEFNKRAVSSFLNNPLYNFPNLVHPTITLDESVRLGIGNILCEGSISTIMIQIGSFNYINRSVMISHDCNIGSYNILNPGCIVSGGVKIGDENIIGAGATILQYLRIGSKSVLGACALLTTDLMDNQIGIGIPAKQSLKL